MSGENVAEAMSYKLRHEEFVSGLSGGPIGEIYVVSLVAIGAYATWCCLQSRMYYFSQAYSVTSLVADFSLNWLSPLFSMTLYADMPVTLNVLILVPALLVGLSQGVDKKFQRAISHKKQTQSKPSELSEYLPKRSYLTCYRGGMLVLTCAAILAVDFKEFPRRFAKVETWGTSLMDLGVGSFVFSMGLVSARTALVDAYEGKTTPVMKSLVLSFKQSFSVLLLGVIRLICVKAFDYHEHVTEYGIHWNFFMTLGLLPPFVSIIGFLSGKIPTFIFAWVVSLGYELALNHTDLLKFVLTAPRVDVISANREGIFSFIGYLAIFLAGKATGFYTLPSSISGFKSCLFPQSKAQYTSTKTDDSRLRVISLLLGSSVLHNALLLVTMQWITPSRRLANLPYVLWVVSYNTAFLALYVVVEAIFFGKHHNYDLSVPTSLDAINYNGLGIFLLANVGTGLINMNMKTLDVERPTAVATLVGYLSVLFLVSIALYRARIRVKL